MRDTPCASKLPAKTWFAASEGWNPSQNTYDVALVHVPRDLSLQSREVSSVPVPQQALLDSKKPAKRAPISQGKTILISLLIHLANPACFTIISGLHDHVQERLVYVKDQEFEARHLVQKAFGCVVQFLVEGNGILASESGAQTSERERGSLLSYKPEAAEAKLAPVRRSFPLASRLR
ncbi:hypothetical protein QQP08_017561 [Theobroma cacao]|nr:hypothetical protein QQP08_017561 [Theobroma cacao]